MSYSASPWTGALQGPLFMKFSKQEYWSGLPFPFPGNLPDPGMELCIAGRFFTIWATREAKILQIKILCFSFFNSSWSRVFLLLFSFEKITEIAGSCKDSAERYPMCSSPIFPMVRSYEIRVQYQNGNWRLVQCLCIVRTRDLFKKIGDIKGLFHARISKIKDRNKGPNRSRRD